jgi:hypothetical protein
MPKQAVLSSPTEPPRPSSRFPSTCATWSAAAPAAAVSKRFSTATRSSAAARSRKSPSSRPAGRSGTGAAGQPVPVYVGMRNWRPYIPDVVRQMRADGVEEAAVLCMAPQNSRTSVGLYRRAVEAEAGGLRIDFTEAGRSIRSCRSLCRAPAPALSKLSAEVGAPVPVLFTAHSVPAAPFEPPPPRPRIPAAGISPFRARAPAAARGSAPPSRRPSKRSPLEGRQDAAPPAHRLSLRPRRNSLRRGYSLPRLRRQTRHPKNPRAARIAERLRIFAERGLFPARLLPMGMSLLQRVSVDQKERST